MSLLLQTPGRRVRLFAMPMRGSEYYEFDAFTMNYHDGRVLEVETGAADRKYIKRMRKDLALMKVGILMPAGTRVVLEGYFGRPERTFTCYGDTVRFAVHCVAASKRIEAED